MRAKLMFGVICVLSATTFAGCQGSQPVDAAANVEEPLKLEAEAPVQKAVAKPAPAKAPAKAAAKPAAASATNAAVAARPADAEPAAPPTMASRNVAARQDDADPIATTMSGCLVRDDGTFRLKDTDGEHAPKSRSWKSGFIRKGSARVDVIDASNRLKLGSFVGHRVTVSGTLTDREMHARSVRPSAERCD